MASLEQGLRADDCRRRIVLAILGLVVALISLSSSSAQGPRTSDTIQPFGPESGDSRGRHVSPI